MAISSFAVSGTIALAGDLPANVVYASRAEALKFELPHPIDKDPNFNWFFRGVRREHGAQQAMYEPLFLFNSQTGKLDPWLAKSIAANPTQDVWTLNLRDDVKWSDSTPGKEQRFTADDVVFTATVALTPDFAPTAYEAVTFRAQVKSVKKIDDFTVEFTLNHANPRFALETFGATMFGSFLIMPKHVWSGQDPKTFAFYNTDPGKGPLAPVGTGPYKLKEIDKSHVLWERDPEWWGAKLVDDPQNPGHKKPAFRPLPEPLQLEWVVVDNLVDSKSSLVKNDLDAARPYSLADLTDVQGQNPKIVGFDPSSARAWNDPCARQIDVNTKNAIWSDPNLRRALSLLIDRTQLAHAGYKDTTIPSKTMFAEYGAMKPFIDAVVNANRGVSASPDVAAAKTLLGPAGYVKDADGFYKKNGAKLGATLKVDSSIPADVDAATTLGDQLKAAGVDIYVKAIPHDELWGHDIPMSDYDMVYSWLSCGSVGEPFTSMDRYSTKLLAGAGYRVNGFRNTVHWDTPGAQAYSDAVAQIGQRPLGDAAVPGMVADAYQYLHDEMPFIPLVQSPTIVPFNTTHWEGWPAQGGDTTPMTNWESTIRLIFELKKAAP